MHHEHLWPGYIANATVPCSKWIIENIYSNLGHTHTSLPPVAYLFEYI